MPADPLLSQGEVKGRFDYNPETGIFIDRATGKVAGTPNAAGYLMVRLGGKNIGLHRVAFLWMLGHYPSNMVDHANGDTSDNRWANLRPATARQNQQNRRPSDANFGYKGVKRGRHGRWTATIVVYGKIQQIPGSFESAYAAHQAYRAVATRLFGQYARFDMPLSKAGSVKPTAWSAEAQLDELERRKADIEQQLRDTNASIEAIKPSCPPADAEIPGKYATRDQVREYERKLRQKQIDDFLDKRAQATGQCSISTKST